MPAYPTGPTTLDPIETVSADERRAPPGDPAAARVRHQPALPDRLRHGRPPPGGHYRPGRPADAAIHRKADLRARYPFGMFAVPRERIARIHASSRTTGQPIAVGYTAEAAAARRPPCAWSTGRSSRPAAGSCWTGTTWPGPPGGVAAGHRLRDPADRAVPAPDRRGQHRHGPGAGRLASGESLASSPPSPPTGSWNSPTPRSRT